MTMPKTIGRYEVIDELGRGAMGSVYRANDPMMSRTVAIKTILATALASENGAEFRKRFTREAQAAGAAPRLQHARHLLRQVVGGQHRQRA